MNAGNHRRAIVFIQTAQHQRCVVQVRALRDAGAGLDVAAQAAGDGGFKNNAFGGEVLAQAQALPLTQSAQLVVIGSAERGLRVSDEVKLSHIPI